VHVSGQVAWDADRNVVGGNDIGRQLEKSLENLATALASVGASLDQVGALRLYIKQSHIHEGGAISSVLKATSATIRRVRHGSAFRAWPTTRSSSRSKPRPFSWRVPEAKKGRRGFPRRPFGTAGCYLLSG
jgi:hypothetical protein